MAAAFMVSAAATAAEDAALTLRATAVGAATSAPLAIELFRWSTDAERAPLLAALAPPASPPADTGRAAAGPGRAGGRGGRGGRGAPPATPAVRLSAAVAAAPTVGFIWGDGPTGYSIRYAWRSSDPEAGERIVLVTNRRLGAHTPSWPLAAPATADAEFTLLELRVDAKGFGEGKYSLAGGVMVDADAKTLALEGYAAAPVLLKVMP